jgi:small-conductance mechanosensitive channel
VNNLGVRLIGINHVTAHKLLLTLAAIAAVFAIRLVLAAAIRLVSSRERYDRTMFWTRQGISLAAFVLTLLVIVSIWLDDPGRLTTVAGFAAAGLAIASQKLVTSFAGYLVIMRGKTFTVGDRIKMGGVQGDVISLGFLQTRILEMGQPPEINEQEAPGMWVRARQFTGRIVIVTNDKLFDEPVYNFTREFPFIWDELRVAVPYRANGRTAEEILLRRTREATAEFQDESRRAREQLQHKYGRPLDDGAPRVFWRLTDNWLELTVRFIVPAYEVRSVKDRIARTVLHDLDAAHIEIASTTIELTGVPPLRIEQHERT